MKAAWAIAALLGLGFLGACGGSEESPRGQAEVIDLRAGSFRGVALGDSRRRVRRVFGPPVEDPDTADLLLGDRYFGDVGFPFTISPPRRPSPSYKRRIVVMTYEDVGFSVERRAGVFVIAILADGSRTSKGVGLGSTGQEVKVSQAGFDGGY